MQKKHIILYLPLFAFFVLINSCGYQQVSREAPEINEIKKNECFKINLPEDHNKLQLWQLDRTFDRAILEDLTTVWHGNENGIDFNFKTLDTGQTTLRLVLRTHQDTVNVKNFIVKIVEN